MNIVNSSTFVFQGCDSTLCTPPCHSFTPYLTRPSSFSCTSVPRCVSWVAAHHHSSSNMVSSHGQTLVIWPELLSQLTTLLPFSPTPIRARCPSISRRLNTLFETWSLNSPNMDRIPSQMVGTEKNRSDHDIVRLLRCLAEVATETSAFTLEDEVLVGRISSVEMDTFPRF